MVTDARLHAAPLSGRPGTCSPALGGLAPARPPSTASEETCPRAPEASAPGLRRAALLTP